MNASRIWVSVCLLIGLLAGTISADTFGTGSNQFTMDFVPISGATNPTSGYGIVNNDYRMGKFEVTNGQWNKFKASLGVPVVGMPFSAYGTEPKFAGTNVPTNCASWCEAIQFVNWLNTSTGHQAAYKFTGTQGLGNYTLAKWSVEEAENGTNLFRHKDAKYYLPTEDEWVKAAYWNGTTLKTYATKAGDTLFQGNGTNGGWNYGHDYSGDPPAPWGVGSGSEELNGTFDMMGNVMEWMEGPYTSGRYTSSNRGIRGGSYASSATFLEYSLRNYDPMYCQFEDLGFRVASEAPEPATLSLLALGGLAMMRRRR